MRKNRTPIIDHLFGDADLPENAAPWLLQHWQGLHHYYRKTPSYPTPGTSVTLFASTSSEKDYAQVWLFYTTDEWHTQNQTPFVKGEPCWDALRWGWLTEWHLALPPQAEGTLLHYRIGAQPRGEAAWVFADNQAGQLEEATHFSLWYAEHQPPGWSKDAIVYQVFVDRFNPGQGKTWTQTSDLMQPMGGTLRGVTEKLEFIREMGFNTIWLTPIFDSPSHHGYDTRDYLKINPRLGSEADFEALLERAHQLGLRVILDFVANHCSDQHPAFVEALAKQNSPFHDWFTWQPWPHYQCFYNVKEMPELDLRYGKPARVYLLEMARTWLQLGVDGFRLDYAHGPERDFWVDFQKACREVNPDCWTFGEIVQGADQQLSFAGGINGSLDFLTCQALRLSFAQQTWPLSRLAGFLQAQQAYYPANFSLPAFIDNHDMNRFLFSAHGDLRLVIMALQLLYFLPGQPVVYYGTEAALSQRQSIHEGGALGFDEARLPMPWSEQDNFPLVSLLQQLAKLRRDWQLGEALPLDILQVDDRQQTLVLQRGKLLLTLNRSDEPQTVSFASGAKALKDICTAEVLLTKAGQVQLTLPPLSARFFAADEPC